MHQHTKSNSLYVQTYLAINLILILIQIWMWSGDKDGNRERSGKNILDTDRQNAGLIPWLSLSKYWQYGWIIQHMVWMSAQALSVCVCIVYHNTHLWAYFKFLSDPAWREDVPREGHEQYASPVRRGGQPDEGEPGSSPGGGGQETQSDPGERSQQRWEGQEPPAGCEYTHTHLHRHIFL